MGDGWRIWPTRERPQASWPRASTRSSCRTGGFRYIVYTVQCTVHSVYIHMSNQHRTFIILHVRCKQTVHIHMDGEYTKEAICSRMETGGSALCCWLEEVLSIWSWGKLLAAQYKSVNSCHGSSLHSGLVWKISGCSWGNIRKTWAISWKTSLKAPIPFDCSVQNHLIYGNLPPPLGRQM